MDNDFFEEEVGDKPEVSSVVAPVVSSMPAQVVATKVDANDFSADDPEDQWIAHSHKESASCVLPKLLSSDDKRLIDLFVRVFGQFESKVSFTKVSGNISDVMTAPAKRKKK